MYKIGYLVAAGAQEKSGFGSTLGVFLSLYFLFYHAWVGRMTLEAALLLEDNVHRLNHVLQALLLAVAAYYIPRKLYYLEEYDLGQAMAITVCLGLNGVLRVVVWVELACNSGAECNARMYGAMTAAIESASVLCAAGGIVAVYLRVPIGVVAGLWFAQYFTPRLLWLLVRWSGWLGPSCTVPWDLGYAITRFGQFAMICLGEGVLQVVWNYSETTARSVSLFFFSYMVLSLLLFLRLMLQPDHPWDHVLYKSRGLSLVWIEAFGCLGAALVSVGASLKVLLLAQRAFGGLPQLYAAYNISSPPPPEQATAGCPETFPGVSDDGGLTTQADVARLCRYTGYASGAAGGSALLMCALGAACFFLFLLAVLHDMARRSPGLDSSSSGGGSKQSRKGRPWRRRLEDVAAVLLPALLFPGFAFIGLQPWALMLLATALLLLICLGAFVTGRARRRRRFGKTVAVIVLIGRLKLYVQRRRERQRLAAAVAAAAPRSRQPEHEREREPPTSNDDSEEPQPAPRAQPQLRPRPWLRRLGLRWADLYAAPALRDHSSMANDWSSIFLDLTLIGAVLKLDLSSSFVTSEVQAVVLLAMWSDPSRYADYILTITTLLMCWLTLMLYNSALTTNDIAHGVVDSLLGVLLGFIAASSWVFSEATLSSTYDARESKDTVASSCLVLFYLITLGKMVELHRRVPAARSQALLAAGFSLLVVLLGAGAVALDITAKSDYPLLCSFLQAAAYPILLGALAAMLAWRGCESKSKSPTTTTTTTTTTNKAVHVRRMTIPLDMRFVTSRLLEIEITFLGIAVLLLTLPPPTIASAEGGEATHDMAQLVIFILAYAFLVTLVLLVFNVVDFNAHNNPLARMTAARKLMLLALLPFFFSALAGSPIMLYLSLVTAGAGAAQFSDINTPFAVFYLMLFAALWLIDLVQEGPREMHWGPSRAAQLERAAAYLLKAYALAQVALLFYVFNVDAAAFSAVLLSTTLLGFAAHAVHREARTRSAAAIAAAKRRDSPAQQDAQQPDLSSRGLSSRVLVAV